MSSIVIAGDTSGSVTLQAPAVAGSTVLNLPSTSGTIQTSGAGYTTNGVAYATSTSVLATGSALTFDGTNLGLTGNFSASNASSVGTVLGEARLDIAKSGSSYMELQALLLGYNYNMPLVLQRQGGNVGIGTSSPATKLHVLGAGTANTYSGLVTIQDNTYPNSGNPTLQFMSWGGGNSYYSAVGGLPYGHLAFYTTTSYGTQPTERARIDSSGNFLFGTTSTSAPATYFLNESDGGAFVKKSTSTSTRTAFYFYINASLVGSISTSGSSTTYSTSSDYRLKENIAPMTGALNVVSQLKPCTYTWKSDGSNGQGFIAHELQAVVPDAVVGEKDAVDEEGNIKPQGIDTSFLVATLTAAIQEQQALINTLTDRISVLENK